MWGTELLVAGVLATDDNFPGAPPGPPGLNSFPFVIGLLATAFPRGVGLDTELGGSP